MTPSHAAPASRNGLRWLIPAAAGLLGTTLIVLAGCQTPPAPLPAQPARLATANAALAEARLGARLFFEPKLSGDGTISCASCHQPDKGFGDGLPVAVGIRGQKGPRNSPTVVGLADSPFLFWDGRAKTLEEQALGPIENPVEMGAKLDDVLTRLNRDPAYRRLFQDTFGGPATRERLGRAIASFERAIKLKPSAWDRFMAGDASAMTPQQQRGWEVFQQARCATCHTPPAFTDHNFHNLGQGTTRPHPDVGRMAVTGDQRDWAAFKTPTLRNVTKSAPYMHDGTLRNLRAVLALYQVGGIRNPNLDPGLQPFPFLPSQRDDLIAFLDALSSEDNLNELLPPDVRRR